MTTTARSLIALALLSAAPAALAGPSKVDICHATGSGSYVLINISTRAASAHLAHGDHYPFDVFADVDGDGYGDPDSSTTACAVSSGWVLDDSDCDDSDADVNPGVAEVDGNGIDDDCDGEIDPTTYDGWLVVTRDTTGSDELWAISDDGSTYVQLTDGLSASSRVASAVSWDGERIAYSSGNHIYVMDADGDNLQHVTATGLGHTSWISWMADDESLLYQGPGTCTEYIKEINVDTGVASTFYDVSNILQRPEANPVDEDLALVSNQTCGNGVQTIYLYDAGAGSRTKITSYFQWWIYAWAYDGANLAYVTGSSGYQDLVVHDLSSSTVLYSASGSDRISKPTWGNDDAYIYVEQTTTADILRVDASTGTAIALGVTDLAPYHRLSWGRLGDIDRDGDGLANGIDPYPDTP